MTPPDKLAIQAQADKRLRSLVIVCVFATTLVASTVANKASVAQDLSDEQKQTFSTWLSENTPEIVEHGVKEEFVSGIFQDLTPDSDVIRLSQNQPEHTRTIGDYINTRVSDKRIAAGRAALEAHAPLLTKLEEKYGVPRTILVSIWGLESSYGANTGSRPVTQSLATLAAFDKRRSNFWKRQLIAALRMAQRGDIPPENMTGSWAGAMGHTQFIPTTFEAFGEDFDGDGKRDIWSNPADALASAANYLRESGWQTVPDGVAPWGYEVTVPKDFDYANAGLSTRKPGREWQTLGITCPKGGSIPSDTPFSLIVPQGSKGPAFLVTPNFQVILRYNNARSYALSVAHLSDRLIGGKPFIREWPNVKPLTRSQRKLLQEMLVARGYDTGGIDGILGNKSAVAIRAEQKKQGGPADGFADQTLLKLLQHNGLPHVGETE